MPAPAHQKLLFKHSTFLPGRLCCRASLPELLSFFFFSFPSFPLLVPQVLCMLASFLLPFPRHWLWFIYDPGPSPSQHPLENGSLESAAWVPPCEKLMLRLEEATEVSVISVASSLFLYLSSPAVVVLQQGTHGCSWVSAVPALRVLSLNLGAGYESVGTVESCATFFKCVL